MTKKQKAKKRVTKRALGNVTIQNHGDSPLHVLVPDTDGNTAIIEIKPGVGTAVDLPEGREIRAHHRPA